LAKARGRDKEEEDRLPSVKSRYGREKKKYREDKKGVAITRNAFIVTAEFW
jgi:hypothetical protein